jgi:hypothetical protein
VEAAWWLLVVGGGGLAASLLVSGGKEELHLITDLSDNICITQSISTEYITPYL